MLGAGGVGKAIVYGLTPPRRQRGGQPTASPGRRSRWRKRFDCRSVEWAARHSVAADLLVNCTPVGMHPNVDETPFEKHHLRPSMIVFDAVYNPENTLLVKEARSRNCTVVTGVDMFVRQACLQFELFTGQEGPAELDAGDDPPGDRRGEVLRTNSRGLAVPGCLPMIARSILPPGPPVARRADPRHTSGRAPPASGSAG